MSDNNKNAFKGIVFLLFIIVFIGGCAAYATNNLDDDWDYRNDNDMGSYLKYKENQDKYNN